MNGQNKALSEKKYCTGSAGCLVIGNARSESPEIPPDLVRGPGGPPVHPSPLPPLPPNLPLWSQNVPKGVPKTISLDSHWDALDL